MKSVMVWGALVLILLVVVGGLIVFSGSQPTGEETDEVTVIDESAATTTPSVGLGLPTTSPATDVLPLATPSPVTLGTEGTTTGTTPITIDVDDTGFNPATVTIPVNTTVTFTNNGQALHWPASDNHPTHEILPEFDSKKGLQTGESYSHTFTKIGTWEFHDHLNPRAGGKIIVQ